MTPKEYTNELFNKFWGSDRALCESDVKFAMKICVKEIIQASPNEFWIEVLKEIENL